MTKQKSIALFVIVVLLAAAGLLLVTFTKQQDTPWHLAQNLKTEDVDGIAWYHTTERPLRHDETARLILRINALKKADFTEDRSLESLPPQYGIKLQGDKTIDISQADAPEGAIAMLYNGRRWWINNDALTTCIYEICQQQI